MRWACVVLMCVRRWTRGLAVSGLPLCVSVLPTRLRLTLLHLLPLACLQFDRLVPGAWRVANSNDAVTLVPRLCGYCHVGHKAQLGAEGRVELTSEALCPLDVPAIRVACWVRPH